MCVVQSFLILRTIMTSASCYLQFVAFAKCWSNVIVCIQPRPFVSFWTLGFFKNIFQSHDNNVRVNTSVALKDELNKHLLPVSKWACKSLSITWLEKEFDLRDPCQIWSRFHVSMENIGKSSKIVIFLNYYCVNSRFGKILNFRLKLI